MVYALAVIGLCNILLIICLSRRIEDIGMRIKTNGALIDDVRDIMYRCAVDVSAVCCIIKFSLDMFSECW